MKPQSQRPIAFVLSPFYRSMMILNRNDYATPPNGKPYGVGYWVLNEQTSEPPPNDEIELVGKILRIKRELAGDGVVVLDCGANIGTHTVEWARVMHGWGQVIAIEAQEYIYYALAGNIALNNCFNARAMWVAVGAEPGTIRVPIVDYHKNASYASLELRPSTHNEYIGQDIGYTEDKTTPVPLITIDSLQLPRLDFLKIDIEGMEEECLAGAVQTITRYRPPMLIEVIKSNQTALQTFLVSHGYRLLPSGMNWLAIHESDPLNQNIVQQSTN